MSSVYRAVLVLCPITVLSLRYESMVAKGERVPSARKRGANRQISSRGSIESGNSDGKQRQKAKW